MTPYVLWILFVGDGTVWKNTIADVSEVLSPSSTFLFFPIPFSRGLHFTKGLFSSLTFHWLYRTSIIQIGAFPTKRKKKGRENIKMKIMWGGGGVFY
jgi:hypothetical protein